MLNIISSLLSIAIKLVCLVMMFTTFGIVDFFDIDLLD
jgi:hypothetical protein